MCEPSPLKNKLTLKFHNKQNKKAKLKKTNTRGGVCFFLILLLPVFNGTQKMSVGNKVGFPRPRQCEPSSRTNPLKDP